MATEAPPAEPATSTAGIEYPLKTVTKPVDPKMDGFAPNAFAATPEQTPPVAPAQTGNPWDQDQAFKDLVAAKGFACPGSPVGDYAFTAWLYDFYKGASGGTPPVTPPAPTLTSLTPATGVAGADVTVAIVGTGFDAGATVDVGGTTLTPEVGGTATDLSVIIPGTSIPSAGPVQVAVKNSDAQWSNQLQFDVT